MAGIFEELRKAREAEAIGAVNEGADGEAGTQDTTIGAEGEGAPAEGTPETTPAEGAPADGEGAPAETPAVNEGAEGEGDDDDEEGAEGEGEVNEEVLVLACPHCGIISGVNEAAVEECPICGEDALLEKVVKVVRDGKVVKKKVPSKKKILTPAQKAALAKARKKAHTAGANKKRKKSMKVANRLNDEDYYECPDCGFSGDLDEFDTEDGVTTCPECGAEITVKESKKCNEEVDSMRAMLESMDAPEAMFTALENGKTEMVNRYIERMVGEE